MLDDFAGYQGAPGGPYKGGVVVTPSDTVNFVRMANALYVGVAQTALTVLMEDGVAVNFGAVPAGTTLRVRARRVNNTNTSPGTNIIALY